MPCTTTASVRTARPRSGRPNPIPRAESTCRTAPGLLILTRATCSAAEAAFPRTFMIHFVVHDENDSVGVVVVEGVKAGQELTGWIMDQDKDLKVKAMSDIPIGHKLAIRSLGKDATVIKYGVDIGRVVAPIQVGEHAHVHNIKTKRW